MVLNWTRIVQIPWPDSEMHPWLVYRAMLVLFLSEDHHLPWAQAMPFEEGLLCSLFPS